MSRTLHERHPAGMGGSYRGKSHTERGVRGSDNYCRPTVREVLMSERGRPSFPVHPASAACVHAGSTSLDQNHQSLPQQGPEVTGGAGGGWREGESTDSATKRAARYVKDKVGARRRRNEDGCSTVSEDIFSAQPQAVAREDQSNRTVAGPANGDRRRASLLKVRKWQR